MACLRTSWYQPKCLGAVAAAQTQSKTASVRSLAANIRQLPSHVLQASFPPASHSRCEICVAAIHLAHPLHELAAGAKHVAAGAMVAAGVGLQEGREGWRAEGVQEEGNLATVRRSARALQKYICGACTCMQMCTHNLVQSWTWKLHFKAQQTHRPHGSPHSHPPPLTPARAWTTTPNPSSMPGSFQATTPNPQPPPLTLDLSLGSSITS